MKHSFGVIFKDEVDIEEKNPLKQGLKQVELGDGLRFNYIEEKNPLKQGLKLDIRCFYCDLFLLKRRIH